MFAHDVSIYPYENEWIIFRLIAPDGQAGDNKDNGTC